MTFTRMMIIPALVCCLVEAQEANLGEIERVYEATFNSMRQAKSKVDIERMVDAIDAPEWQGHLPTGAILSRSEAIASLTGLLAIPPESRPIPRQQMLSATEASWSVTVLYWIYREDGDRLIGSLARDTWVRTSRGWRRIRHEKLFSERLLVQGGKSMILSAR